MSLVNSEGDREECARGMVLRSILISIGIVCLGIFCFAWQAPSWAKFLSVIGTAFIIAMAAFFSGGLFGFLFGVPHMMTYSSAQSPQRPLAAASPPPTATQATPAQEASSPTSISGSPVQIHRPKDFEDNTNLEQISDWLSKILVGAGLTQITQIPTHLKRYAAFFATGLLDSQVFAMGLIVFFPVCGFMVGYLWTRLHLGSALVARLGARMQAFMAPLDAQLTQVSGKVRDLEEQAKIDAKALSLVERQLNPISGTPMPSQDELNAAIKPASTPARSRIFFKAQKLREENWKVDKAKMAMTIPIFRALIAADEENIYPANHAELGFALKDQREPQFRAAEDELTKAIEIRDNLGGKGYLIYEFNRALCRIYQDAGFKAGPSDDKIKQAILAELKAAAQEASLTALIAKEPDIKTWLGNNNLDLTAICPVSTP